MVFPRSHAKTQQGPGGVKAKLSFGTGQLLRLSVSAFVVLAAEPSFVLVDTAVVGHLGPVPLGALGIAGTLLSLVTTMGGFIEYGTTARAARWFGARQHSRAIDEGVSASFLAILLGLLAIIIGEIFAGPLLDLLAGGQTPAAIAAQSWFRIAVLGMPAVLLILAGNGWMRGVQNKRQPVYIALFANVLSAAASPVLVYVFGFGLIGSALANLASQMIAGALFLAALYAQRRPFRINRAVLIAQVKLGKDLLGRSIGFQVAFLTSVAVAAHMGTVELAGQQVGVELWLFLALILDSFAIAAQSLVGAALGGNDVAQAKSLAWKVSFYGFLAGSVLVVILSIGWQLIPQIFTSSLAVRHQIYLLWPFLVVMEPAAGVVFALDGVLIGAGDVSFLRTLTLVATVGISVPIDLLALNWHWGIQGLWVGLSASVAVRLMGILIHTKKGKWAIAGIES